MQTKVFYTINISFHCIYNKNAIKKRVKTLKALTLFWLKRIND